MILSGGHEFDRSGIYKILNTPGEVSNMVTTTILQLIFKIMVKKKGSTLAYLFSATYLNMLTRNRLTLLIRYWDPIHILAEDMELIDMIDTVRHIQVE